MRYVTTVGLLLVILVSPAASQPPTLAEQPLAIEGRVLWIDFGSETLMLAPATGGSPIPILAAKLQRGSVRISAAISWPRVTTARAIAATIGS
jgi:hypothetical protein